MRSARLAGGTPPHPDGLAASHAAPPPECIDLVSTITGSPTTSARPASRPAAGVWCIPSLAGRDRRTLCTSEPQPAWCPVRPSSRTRRAAGLLLDPGLGLGRIDHLPRPADQILRAADRVPQISGPGQPPRPWCIRQVSRLCSRWRAGRTVARHASVATQSQIVCASCVAGPPPRSRCREAAPRKIKRTPESLDGRVSRIDLGLRREQVDRNVHRCQIRRGSGDARGPYLGGTSFTFTVRSPASHCGVRTRELHLASGAILRYRYPRVE